ncbi:MAG TPA: beta-ketoacyl-ACP synthase III [Tepidisphaeraceae bacterium]|jgi:3-oxoacyl-[acyl-carrier-protein] synthase-3|nr:beta-ketoacyl-ACP synthase III [Tepidisphaeraceae bacterium]
MSNFGAIIAGTGSYVPEKRLTNDDLAKMVDTNDEWIVQRTGIKERRIAGPGESTATLATVAARKALEAAKLQPSDLDLIICGTVTGEMVFPSTACFVAAALGLNSTPAFDVSAACSGFIYTLQTGAAFIKSGLYKNVLVLGAETLSRITDYTDRGSCILFGDGAGAVVLSRSNDPTKGVIYSSLHADGNGWELLSCKPGSRHPLSASLLADGNQYMKLKGREVYKFAVQRFEELIIDAMRKCELTADDIKLIVPHQVNQRIIDSAMDKLHLGMDKAYVNIDRYGNTSSASIPIALDEAVRSGRIVPGDVILTVAFGAGLTWANAVIRM